MTRRRSRRTSSSGRWLLTVALAAIVAAFLAARASSRAELAAGLIAGLILGLCGGTLAGRRSALNRAIREAAERNTARTPRAAASRRRPPRNRLARQFSPECLGGQCELCDDPGCTCDCNHDPLVIADRNRARYDREHAGEDIPPF